MMSIKICAIVIVGLLSIINESESIKCVQCLNWISGGFCYPGTLTNLIDCPYNKYCIQASGYGKFYSFDLIHI